MNKDTENTELEELKKEYANLVDDVRMRQHALENQLTAAKGMDPEEKDRYLEELNRDQRYNHLMLCGDPLVAGLIFQKCRLAEEKGIEASFRVYARLRESRLLVQRKVAALGILLDNAIEAEESLPGGLKRISVVFSEEGGWSAVTVSNLHPYIPYDEMGSMFAAGHSSKGSGRGLGLAHVKKICDGGAAEIVYGNRESDEGNEVFFTLRLKNADTSEASDVSEPLTKPDSPNASVSSIKSGISNITGSSAKYGLSNKFSSMKSGSKILVFSWLLIPVILLFFVCLFVYFKLAKGTDNVLFTEEFLSYGVTEPDRAQTLEMINYATGSIDSARIPERRMPYFLYSDIGLSEDESKIITFPENAPYVVSPDKEYYVQPRRITFEHYDEAGRNTGRDVYVAGGMDTPEDKAVMKEAGEDISLPSSIWSCREQEYIEYDGSGREKTRLFLKRYGEALKPVIAGMSINLYDADGDYGNFGVDTISVSVAGTGEDDNDMRVGITQTGESGKTESEYLVAETGEVLWKADYAYDLNEGKDTAYVTEIDYNGDLHKSINRSDANGNLSEALFLRDGEAFAGYMAVWDERGLPVEEINDMPLLQRNRLQDEYLNTFYDSEHTHPWLPRQSIGLYIYHVYDTDGREVYRIEADTLDGYGELYLYEYDADGRLSVTYDYRIWGPAMDGFSLKLEDGESLNFTGDHTEYTLYEKEGGMWDIMQRYITEITHESAGGIILSKYTFDEGHPVLMITPDGETDWSEPFTK